MSSNIGLERWVTKPMRSVLVAFAAACVWAFPRGAFTAPSRQPSLSQGQGGARRDAGSLAGLQLQHLERGQEVSLGAAALVAAAVVAATAGRRARDRRGVACRAHGEDDDDEEGDMDLEEGLGFDVKASSQGVRPSRPNVIDEDSDASQDEDWDDDENDFDLAGSRFQEFEDVKPVEEKINFGPESVFAGMDGEEVTEEQSEEHLEKSPEVGTAVPGEGLREGEVFTAVESVDGEARPTPAGHLPLRTFINRKPSAMPRSRKPIDYLSVRLNSASDIRQAAHWLDYEEDEISGELHARKAYAEVLTGGDFIIDRVDGTTATVPGGLYCEKLFGKAQDYRRRKQSGFFNLAWPSNHVWFSGIAKLGGAAKVLGRKSGEIKRVRQFQSDVYFGEWTAANLFTMTQKPGCTMPQVAAVGSPVAASVAPQIQSIEVAPAPAGPFRARSSIEFGKLTRIECEKVNLTQKAVNHHVAIEAKEISQAVLWSLGAALQDAVTTSNSSPTTARALGEICGLAAGVRSLATAIHNMADFDVTLSSLDPEHDDADKLGEVATAALPKCIAGQLREEGVGEEDILLLLHSASNFQAAASRALDALGPAALQDFAGLWQTLTTPGFEGDLHTELRMLFQSLSGALDRRDAVRAVAAARTLLVRGQAALDLSLSSLKPIFSCGRMDQDGIIQSKLSRYQPKSLRVQWYDPAMQPAAFYVGDVERLQDFLQYSPVGQEIFSRPHLQESDSELPLHEGLVGQRTEDRKQVLDIKLGLSSPDKHRRGGKGMKASKPIYYKKGTADARWHIPLPDASRPGRASGTHPVQPGQVCEPAASPVVARFCAVRPRPAGAPLPLPANAEAEGSNFTTTGGAAVQKALCQADTKALLHQLASDARMLDEVFKMNAHLAEPSPTGMTVASVRDTRLRLSKDSESHLGGMRRRRDMLEAAGSKGQPPESMVLTEMPVLPPDLRTRSAQDPMEFPDDINKLYKDILKAGGLLTLSMLERRPAGLLRFLKSNLQQAVDNVIDNGRIGVATVRKNGTPLESVSKRLKGKKGRMRFNLLGKRVDYSARTVIVVDPSLKLNECGLPYVIAKEIFQGFLIYELIKEEQDKSIFGLPPERLTGTGKAVELLEAFEWRAQEEKEALVMRAMGNRLICLNRAPTLHRLSIQAFKPKLIHGEALTIHPLVCAPFNADFDGDTMTMHVALSDLAQQELSELMLPSRNLSSPANGEPVIGPTQDMVLGIYYLTVDPPPEYTSLPEEVCKDLEGAKQLVASCQAGELSHFTRVSVPQAVLKEVSPTAVEADSALASNDGQSIKTTVGRLLLWFLLHSGHLPPSVREPELLQVLDKASLPQNFQTMRARV